MKLAEAVQLGEKKSDVTEAPRVLKKMGSGSSNKSPKAEKDSSRGPTSEAR
jgi:hypothetical protein